MISIISCYSPLSDETSNIIMALPFNAISISFGANTAHWRKLLNQARVPPKGKLSSNTDISENRKIRIVSETCCYIRVWLRKRHNLHFRCAIDFKIVSSDPERPNEKCSVQQTRTPVGDGTCLGRPHSLVCLVLAQHM